MTPRLPRPSRAHPGTTALAGALRATRSAGFAAALLWVAGAAGETLTMEQAVARALADNPRLAARRASSAAVAEERRSVRGRLLPQVAVSANYYDANSPESFDLAGLLGPAAAKSGAPSTLSISGFQVGFGTVTASQPLLGLWHRAHELAAASDRAASAQEDLKTAEADVREQVETQFLAVFEARALAGIAKSSLGQLQKQAQITAVKLAHGVATRADLLRVQVAIANARQQGIQADVQERSARAALLASMGLPPGTTGLDFAAPADPEAQPEGPAAAEAQQFAQGHRPEIASAAHAEAAAHHDVLAARLSLLPEIDANAMYVRLAGLPSALPADYFTLGFGLTWPIWDWGQTYYRSLAAEDRDDAAAAELRQARSEVALEVDRRIEDERAAAAAVAVAHDAIAQAQEAFRVTSALVSAGGATTTDLLDAQSALAQAELNLVRARYGELRARAALRRAMGR